MKLKDSGVLVLAVALFFVGLSAQNSAYGTTRELVDIRTIVGDETTLDKNSITAQDALELLRSSVTMLRDQNMNETKLAFELENNGLSDHFEFTHRIIPEPSTLLLLAIGGASLLRRGR